MRLLKIKTRDYETAGGETREYRRFAIHLPRSLLTEAGINLDPDIEIDVDGEVPDRGTILLRFRRKRK